MAKLLDALPVSAEGSLVSVGQEVVPVPAYEIIVWVSLRAKHVAAAPEAGRGCWHTAHPLRSAPGRSAPARKEYPMSHTVDVPVTISPEAAARVAELGLQREFE